jgi:hypothetical protein
MKKLGVLAIAALLACVPNFWLLAADEDTALNNYQIAVMMLVDYGRSYGYQTMIARIQLDTNKAELERDAIILRQKQELYRKKSIPLIELEIAQLKDTWNQRQIVVAEKNLAYVSAEYEAMTQMAKHFGGVKIPVSALYSTFRRGWDAGCDKGPDELVAMKAKMDFLEKVVERSRQLQKQRIETFSALLDKETQLKIARSDYQHRLESLDKCRMVLFPSLKEILSIAP